MGAQGPKQRKEPRYQVMYLASGRLLLYTLSIECVVGEQYTKHSLLVLKIFTIFQLCHAQWSEKDVGMDEASYTTFTHHF